MQTIARLQSAGQYNLPVRSTLGFVHTWSGRLVDPRVDAVEAGTVKGDDNARPHLAQVWARQPVVDEFSLVAVSGQAKVVKQTQVVGGRSLASAEDGGHVHVQLDSDRAAEPGWGRREWGLLELKRVITRWQKDLEGQGWNSQYFSNHDQPRQVSRFGDNGRYRVESAKLLATLLHTLQGTPFIYQGEELGMTNVAFPSIEDYRDISPRRRYRELVEDEGVDQQAALSLVQRHSRDNAGTPMQWDDTDNAGFTTGTPWLKVNPNYREINAAQAVADAQSVYHYYRQLIRLQRANPVVVEGRYDLILDDDPAIYVFTRTLGGDRLLVILNFSAGTPVFALPEGLTGAQPELLVANYGVEVPEAIERFSLRPYEARVYRLR
ncbi:MAG: alpha-amylase family glycosyl hydrolase [Chloroflexota bacterium]